MRPACSQSCLPICERIWAKPWDRMVIFGFGSRRSRKPPGLRYSETRTWYLGQVGSEQLDLEQLAGGEVADEATVGGEEVVAGQVAQVAPAQVVENVFCDFALEVLDGKELQVNRAAIAVGVAHVGYERADCCPDAKLFFKLADERFFCTLTRFHFAAGKLPLEGHGLVGAALANKDFVAAKYERGNNIAHGFGFRSADFLGFDILHAHTSLDGSASKSMQRISELCVGLKISG